MENTKGRGQSCSRLCCLKIVTYAVEPTTAVALDALDKFAIPASYVTRSMMFLAWLSYRKAAGVLLADTDLGRCH